MLFQGAFNLAVLGHHTCNLAALQGCHGLIDQRRYDIVAQLTAECAHKV